MHDLAKSYEALFSRKSKKYAAMNLKNETLVEKDYKQLILEEYTFLKRPVIIIDDKIFIGSDKKTLELLQENF
jgi:arsenate reductase